MSFFRGIQAKPHFSHSRILAFPQFGEGGPLAVDEGKKVFLHRILYSLPSSRALIPCPSSEGSRGVSPALLIFSIFFTFLLIFTRHSELASLHNFRDIRGALAPHKLNKFYLQNDQPTKNTVCNSYCLILPYFTLRNCIFPYLP